MDYKLEFSGYQGEHYSTGSSGYLSQDPSNIYPQRSNVDKSISERSILRDFSRDANPSTSLSLSEHNGYNSLHRDLLNRDQLHRDPNTIYDDSFLYERSLDRAMGFNLSSHGGIRGSALDLSAHGSNLPQHTRHARRLYFGGK